MRIEISGPVSKQCPFVDETDNGTVTLILDAENAPELHQLRAYLDSYRDVRLSHEDFTRQVAADHPGATAQSTWHTAGLEVTCRAVSSERVQSEGEASDA